MTILPSGEQDNCSSKLLILLIFGCGQIWGILYFDRGSTEHKMLFFKYDLVLNSTIFHAKKVKSFSPAK